jgi:predicted ATPase
MHLYERERPLEALRAGLAQAARREGRVVLVAGEAGIGKTSLVASFLNELPLGADVMVGACEALFTPRPLGPLRDIALQLEDPALRDVDAEGDRHAVFTAFLSRLRSNAKPAIVVFEDVHWADEATLDLVKYLGRRIARLPALFVLTYRDDEVGPRHPLRSVIGELPAATTIA